MKKKKDYNRFKAFFFSFFFLSVVEPVAPRPLPLLLLDAAVVDPPLCSRAGFFVSLVSPSLFSEKSGSVLVLEALRGLA